MPKALTISGMVVAALLLIVFGLDLAIGFPFGRGPSLIMDICGTISAALLGYMSWSAYRELA